MRSLIKALSALALAAVTACATDTGPSLRPITQTPAEAEAYIATLSAGNLKGSSAKPADLAAVRDALPKTVALAWASSTFDAASKTTILTDVKLMPAGTQAGLQIKELRLWDFDAELARARLSGQRLNQSGRLARRIEARGISIFGLETLPSVMDDLARESVKDLPKAFGVPAGEPGKVSSYDLSIDRIVLDDVALRPYELMKPPAGTTAPNLDAIEGLQRFAALVRSFAIDSVAANKLTTKVALSVGASSPSWAYMADAYGARGIRGGDVDVAYFRGVHLRFESGVTDAGTPGPRGSALDIDRVSSSGTRFDQALAYLAAGKRPPRDGENFLSLGLLDVSKAHIDLGDHTLFSVDDIALDARTWRWFVPTKLRLSVSNLSTDLRELLTAASTIPPQPPKPGVKPPTPPADLLKAPQMQVLTKYGLDKPSLDLAFGWDWNTNTGAASIETALGLDDFMHVDATYQGDWPTYKAMADAFGSSRDPTTKGFAIGLEFVKTATVKQLDIDVKDEGGVGKSFAIVADASAQSGASSLSLPPELMRTFVAAFARAEASTQPGLENLMPAFADFIEKGGKLHVQAKPQPPMLLMKFAQLLGSAKSTADLAPLNIAAEQSSAAPHTAAAK